MESNFALQTLALSAYVVGTCFIAFAIAGTIERLLDFVWPANVDDDLRTAPSHRFTDRFAQGFVADYAVTLGASDSRDYRFVRRFDGATLSAQGYRYEKSQVHDSLQNAQTGRRRKRRR